MLIPPSGEESVVISYGILNANINNKNKSPKQNEENYTISQKIKTLQTSYRWFYGGTTFTKWNLFAIGMSR